MVRDNSRLRILAEIPGFALSQIPSKLAVIPNHFGYPRYMQPFKSFHIAKYWHPLKDTSGRSQVIFSERDGLEWLNQARSIYVNSNHNMGGW